MNIPKQIVAFCHFKGGVGTSFLASNVALELAKNKILTCLIDFDTKLPNCANILGMEIKKDKSMYNYFNNKNLEARGQYFIFDKNISPNLYVISSSSENEVEILEDINDNGNDIDNLLDSARETFDIVVVDLPLDYQNPQVIGTIEKADKVFVVGDLDINTIENTFRSLQMYKSLNMPLSKFNYIINRYFENNDVTASTIQDTLGIRVGVTVPMDYEAAFGSIIRSKAITNTKHKIADSIKEICIAITGNPSFGKEATNESSSNKFKFNVAKEEVAPTKFTLVFDEEGDKSDGSSES